MENNQTEEVISELRKSLEYNAKDEDLISAINTAVRESQSLKEKMDKIGKDNKTYWEKGTTTDLNKIHPKRAKVVNNRIFLSVETIVPIVTAETPEPEAAKNIDNSIREDILNALKIAYEVTYKMKQKLQKLVRSWFWNRIGVMKYRWDEDFRCEIVKPRNIFFDPTATCFDDCEYMGEYVEDTIENIKDKFKGKKGAIKKLDALFENKKTKIKYVEFWGGNGEWVAWKYNDILFDKKKNPNFDYKNPENNLFENPRFPYLIYNVFNSEETLYDDTSLIEQCSSIQEAISKIERQIIDLNEGQKQIFVISADTMSEEKAVKLNKDTGATIVYLDRGAPPQGAQVFLSGKPDASIFNDLSHLIGEIDNIMGTHSTTRGERKETETLGGRQLMMQADYGRLDLIITNLEQFMEDWYNALLHMLKVYKTGEDISFASATDSVDLNTSQIPKETLIMVKKGSSLPTDKISRMYMALEMLKADRIDPETMFDEMGYADPQGRAEKLWEYWVRTGKAQPEPPMTPQQQQLKRIQELMDSSQFKKLPDDQKAVALQQIRQAVDTIKSSAQQPPMAQQPQMAQPPIGGQQ